MNIPNTLSIMRILFVILMFLFKKNIFLFLIFYIIACVTDILDGYIARKFNKITKLGQKLDSFGDLILYISTLYFIYYFNPYLIIDFLLYILIIVFIRLLNIIIAYIKYKKFLIYHTYLNKSIGILYGIFFPLIILFKTNNIIILTLTSLSLIATIEESIILTIKNISDADYKGLFFDNK
ncbi:CDP-alcohol phosphatidyltransferase family protein [Oceanotoga sp. DSM 15011]|uniref:CDP-alcohol phosphatidyltransferase family protein n=1 Tax=Oceanotoga sp. DSM 15011 TaxID=2984951 RepID=UPI0021F46D2A|nr:CDP-alcohol phosphatidyltransferase family protein [Oceanotoga sp. DSM 15011]UYP00547.1 CDP-alcohol phosphatidyltransferase family protein [Oceanotoga sp. DSM 15011]